MKILVIGGSGFLGSHLVPALLQAGDEVTVQDIVPPEGAIKLREVIGDIQYLWKSAIDLSAEDVIPFDQIVHLAGQGDVPLAISSPRLTYSLNVDATLSLLEAVRSSRANQGASPTKVIFMSSDNVYGHVPSERLPATEAEPMQPTNPYGASKGGAELLINSYMAQWNMPVIVLRSTSIFGEGSRLKQVVPAFIQRALLNQPLLIQGDGTQTRDINYVKNVVGAIIGALQSTYSMGTWNIGSGSEVSINGLAKTILDFTASKSKIEYVPWRPGERALRLYLSIEKAKRELSYMPIYSRDEGLKRTIEWTKSIR